jgi:hypothetical protein
VPIKARDCIDKQIRAEIGLRSLQNDCKVHL